MPLQELYGSLLYIKGCNVILNLPLINKSQTVSVAFKMGTSLSLVLTIEIKTVVHTCSFVSVSFFLISFRKGQHEKLLI